MAKVHINNTNHITTTIIYIHPQDSTSTKYKRADTDAQHCIQHITKIPHAIVTGDVKAHSTLWHLYTDVPQRTTDVISNSDNITLNTNTPTRVPNTTLQETSSPDITTVSNTQCNRTSWTTQQSLTSDTYPSSPQSTYDMTTTKLTVFN